MSIEDEAKDLLLKLGPWWPDANSGTLRSVADAWRAFAESVDDVRTPVNNAATTLIANNTGEAIDAFSKFWERYAKGNDAGWLSDLAESSREMRAARQVRPCRRSRRPARRDHPHERASITGSAPPRDTESLT
ncbi:WXG100-like domain-containing protein [Streptomyces sp. BE230]|uniref:WXG100-like domain-containing protein n=1 Tax=Streptomyces sp. BE230 TaxID=3002526 RepID=UPI002ED63A80|nr:hypothetical protein [Streptomyces sp. BE230]